MKKITTAVACVAMLLCTGLQAQVFEDGSKHFQFGVGVGSPYYYSGSKSTIPPIHASFEVGVSDNIGVGALVGYTSSTYEQTYFYGDTYKWKFTYLIIGARGAYHFGLDNDKLDLYAGALLGYNVASAKFESNDPDLEDFVEEPSVGGIAFGAFGGARYAFSEKVGGFAELGYNISWLSIGLHFKF